MMDAVAEHERHNGPPAVRPQGEPVPAPRMQEPAPLDPEQVRQFQQFQQFQELMRRQGDALVPLPPPTRRPVWKRLLGSRLVRRLALLLVVVLGLFFAYDYYFGSDNDNRPASETGGGTNRTNDIQEHAPKRTVRQVYSHVAQDDPPFVCGQFEGGAERQFAANFGAASCEEAVHQLFAQIDKTQPGWRNTYAEPFSGAELAEDPVSGRAVVSSCPLTVSPRLGEFTLRRIEGNRWVITGHRTEGC
jgi:hypothetical protein